MEAEEEENREAQQQEAEDEFVYSWGELMLSLPRMSNYQQKVTLPFMFFMLFLFALPLAMLSEKNISVL